jgi:hypothetical protein
MLRHWVDDPIFAHPSRFVLQILLTPITGKAFRRHDFDDQVGGAFQVVRLERPHPRSRDEHDVRRPSAALLPNRI